MYFLQAAFISSKRLADAEAQAEKLEKVRFPPP
jgi:hypothetical protein